MTTINITKIVMLSKMKLVMNKFLLTALFNTLIIFSVFSQLNANQDYITFGNELVAEDSASSLVFKSNYAKNSQLVFIGKGSTLFGAVKGFTDDQFALISGFGASFIANNNQGYTKFNVATNEKMIILESRNNGIGFSESLYKLDVCGTVNTIEALIEADGFDYFFDKDFQLPSLDEEKEHIEVKCYWLGFEVEEVKGRKLSLNDVTKRKQIEIEKCAYQIL